MTDRHNTLAQNVVKAFKESLSDAAREHITEAQFEDLTLMVREAIAEELTRAAELFEAALAKLRSEIEKPELDL